MNMNNHYISSTFIPCNGYSYYNVITVIVYQTCILVKLGVYVLHYGQGMQAREMLLTWWSIMYCTLAYHLWTVSHNLIIDSVVRFPLCFVASQQQFFFILVNSFEDVGVCMFFIWLSYCVSTLGPHQWAHLNSF